MVDGDEKTNEVPFDMSKETLKSIRLWIDKITQLSLSMAGGIKIPINEMIVTKHDMVRQLIVLASPLMEDDLEEVEEFFDEIKLMKGNIKINGVWGRGVPMYSLQVDKQLDECVKGIQKALRKYFVPEFSGGERY